MSVMSALTALSNSTKADFYAGYFKTGEGEYGHGDVFLGITVPEQRKIAKKYADEISLKKIEELLHTNIHEYRFTALEILVIKYEKSKDIRIKKQIVSFYLKNKKWINNWDLVDTSARYILGDWLLNKSDKDRALLYKLAKSKNMWDRRIAIISTHQFIVNDKCKDTFKIAEMLLHDTHDLIHKAVGWMLREVGNRDHQALLSFLNKHYTKMPRTMLRYAIEKFEPSLRKKYFAK
jgi:3-methyladenine DNA glycosylase AlkD